MHKSFIERNMMNTIIRLVTVSFLVCALVIGIAGYAGSRARSLPLSQAIEDLQSRCAFIMREIESADNAAASAITGLCFDDITTSPPIGCGVADSYPF